MAISQRHDPTNVVQFPFRPEHVGRVIVARELGYVPSDPDMLRDWYVAARRWMEDSSRREAEQRTELRSVRLSRAYWRRKAQGKKAAGAVMGGTS